MREPNLLLDAALTYARDFGWPVFPFLPGRKKPIKGSHGYKDATTDPETIRRWWVRWPKANIGLACGPAGLICIDLDVKGANGLESWQQLKDRYGFDDTTICQ